jgi:hypothetical protein
MLKINFSAFTVDFVKEIVDDWDEKNWASNFGENSYGYICPLDIKINGKRITLPDDGPYGTMGYAVGDTLKNINNSFCVLLIKGEAVVVFNRPDLLKMKIVDDKILFTNEKIRRPELQVAVKDEPANLIQAVEEVIKAKDKYKEICLKAAKKIKPKEIDNFMRIALLERKIKDSDLISNDNANPFWIDLRDVWLDYKKQHNITDEDVKKAIAGEEKDKISRIL